MKKLFSAALAAALLSTLFVGCGDGGNGQNSGDTDSQITLQVDIGGLVPTLSDTPTVEDPDVFVVTQKIADQFMKDHPNVKIEWVRNKKKGTISEFSEWATIQFSASTGPDILEAWGTNFASKGWFSDLTDELNRPNEYIEGNTAWKDSFPSYIWKDIMTCDVNGNILAVPVTLNPGTATAYFYNKDLFSSLGLQVPQTWEQLLANAKVANDAGKIGIAPWGPSSGTGNKNINTGLWDIQFSLSPMYIKAILDKVDYDKDGVMSYPESLRAAYEGHFYAQNNAYAQDMWKQLKRKCTEYLKQGYENTDYETDWLMGNVAMLEDGVWRLPSEKSNVLREFEFDLFPAPVITKETSQYVADIEYTENGPWQPPIQESFTIVKPSLQGRSDDHYKYSLMFLKYLTTPDNVNLIVTEKHGSLIGAVKGTAIPKELEDWFNRPFPKVPNYKWPSGFTPDGQVAMSKVLEQWVKGMIDDKTFYKEYDEAFKKDIDNAIKQNNTDTTGWSEYIPA